MDYAEAAWNREIDGCVTHLMLAISQVHSLLGELDSLESKCQSLRSVIDDYVDIDRYDADVLAEKLRDAVGHEASKLIRTLRCASDETHDIEQVLGSFGR